MEKGQMRVELNISISEDPKVLGTKVEVKNINSFKAMERAAEYEIKRMAKLLDEGKGSEIVQETRGWDEVKQSTFSQRKKENANDYRYFPDPDLPKMFLSKIFDIDKIKNETPELPEAKRNRYRNDYGIKDEDIESYIVDIKLGEYFEKVSSLLLPKKELIVLASNFISNDLIGSGAIIEEFIQPELLSETVEMVYSGELSSRTAKDLILGVAKNFEKGKTIRAHAVENNLIQSNDEGVLKEIVQKIIDANPAVVATYKGGKENAIMSLVGQVMKESSGSANPGLVQKLLKELLA
jgi:aspartyl-tRNA(Asn)/glutamyl-tRNA(Gln) amidotransferase subunit B